MISLLCRCIETLPAALATLLKCAQSHGAQGIPEANRRNARLSTGPVTEEGKEKSRHNALRHGLTAETVIPALEDAEDYAAFEMAVTADFDAQSAVERELVLRLASLLSTAARHSH